ncbi:hypothetical protein BDN72DRAFT_843829 [Pluteus cervinus]|uniref:Uncharacterized protein n=1 Tax=Pluteus cervinus TaxID=181527 RepID=A0ACD3AMN9_9AGAR|nr:hypothetical protein BDN72DRAFT_843829 [Pluteus cervinus]
MSSSPRLPPELEQEIFLLAFHSDGAEVNRLCLVAKRVLDWLIPHRYHVVILSAGRYSPIKFNETVYKKYGHHVRHLLLEDDQAREHLHLFPNVVNLAFWGSNEHTAIDLPPLLQLPLTCISIAFYPNLFRLFAKVTHLDLTTGFHHESTSIGSLLYLPKLTHVCVPSKFSLELFLERERCPQLRVAIVWGLGSGGGVDGGMSVRDKRVVMVRCDPHTDWEIGARGGLDMWRLAEGLISSRNGHRAEI